MTAAYIVFQSIAVFGLLMWWRWWSGRRTTWLEGRRRGWLCFLFLTAFTFFQGVALALIAIGPDTDDPPVVDSDLVRLAAVSLMFLGTPVFMLFTFAWAPRLALPSWIRERLRAGDLVRTAQPAPRVQHLMTKPQNAPSPAPTYEQLQLPTTIKVGLGRWWFGAIVCAICAIVFAVTGLNLAGFQHSLTFGNFVMLLLAPIAAGGSVLFVRSALRPEHLYFTESGIETRNWSLAWEEITGVEISGDANSHQGQVLLGVTPTAHRRVGDKGWNASGLQQAHSEETGDFQIALQPATKAPPGQIATLVQSVIRALPT